MLPELPSLGVGLGYRAPYFSDLFRQRSAVDFLEVTADHFLDAPPRALADLELLAAHFRLIPHGLNLSLGSAEGLSMDYAQKLAAFIEKLSPPWWSEHLAFTRAGGVEIGHLTPLPWSREAVRAVSGNVERMRTLTRVPLILENITYSMRMPGAEMSEGEFLRRVCEESECGWLLDVTNLFVNAKNHGFDASRWLEAAPLEKVVQLHFVGCESAHGTWVDSHSTAVDAGIWKLLEEVLERAPVRGAILERDEALPPMSELLLELAQARELGRKHARWL